jgi:hypothetical protein
MEGLAVKQPIPDIALDDRLGWVGTAGSGKSYNAMGRVERLLAKGARVACVDPLGVFWGLRLRPDGKTESDFNIPIFGGPHGDLPLTEHSGALIGETVAGMAESCIIDLSEIGTKAGERRFMLHFLTALYRKSKDEPLHLVIDEADMFAPQKLTDKEGEAAKLLGMMETVVRRGRIKGFIPWLITQRPAVIAKDVLSQVDGLVAFKLTSSQDRDALSAWVEGSADKEDWKTMRAALPAMERGQGVVWIPGRGIMETVTFPEKLTFDSSRTPKRGEKKSTASLRPLDLGKLKERLATVDAETKANDPKALRERIKVLERDNQTLERERDNARTSATDPQSIADAERRGFKRGFDEAVDQAGRQFGAIKSQAADAVRTLTSIVNHEVKFNISTQDIPSGSPPAHRPAHTPTRTPMPAPAARKSSPAASGDGTLSNPQAHLLRAMAWWLAMGHPQPTRAQLAAIAGWKVGGSNMRGRLAELSTAGLINYPSSDTIEMTEAGHAAAPAPDTSATLIDSIKGMLTNPQALLFDALLNTGAEPVARETVAKAVRWEAGGSNMRGRLAELSSLEVISYPTKGSVALQPWVLG